MSQRSDEGQQQQCGGIEPWDKRGFHGFLHGARGLWIWDVLPAGDR
jgi:hypothetical protein